MCGCSVAALFSPVLSSFLDLKICDCFMVYYQNELISYCSSILSGSLHFSRFEEDLDCFMKCHRKEMISFGCSVLSGSLDLKKILTSYGLFWFPMAILFSPVLSIWRRSWLLMVCSNFLWLFCSLWFSRFEEGLDFLWSVLISYGCSVLSGSLDLKKSLTAVIRKSWSTSLWFENSFRSILVSIHSKNGAWPSIAK